MVEKKEKDWSPQDCVWSPAGPLDFTPVSETAIRNLEAFFARFGSQKDDSAWEERLKAWRQSNG